ncbi:MAG TPA: hypothetical protein VLM44_08075 [Lutibacter sp.]|nr:hypothetical protein [Lutibacter sp.]
MKSEWIAKYENSEIRVVNTWLNGEKLLVNNEIQDERFGIFGSDLTGHVINEKGERKNIKVNLGGVFTISCRIFIDDKKMAVSKIK